jgi:hypothetical protein
LEGFWAAGSEPVIPNERCLPNVRAERASLIGKAEQPLLR